MLKEKKVITRMSGFQPQYGIKITADEDKCLECIGLRCDSCHPVYELDGKRLSVKMERMAN